MQYSLLAGALTLALVTPLVLADSSSSETSTYSTTRTTPGDPTYSSSKSEQKLDEYGNVIKKSETYNSKDAATGDSSSTSSTTISSPDGSQSTVERARNSGDAYGDSSVTEKRTTTTTSP